MLQALAQQLFYRAGLGQPRVLLVLLLQLPSKAGLPACNCLHFQARGGETRIHCDTEAAASRRPSLGQVTEGHGRRVDTERIIHVL